MPELIRDTETGFLVDTVEEAVEAVNQINTIDRVACHTWAASRFSKDKMVADYLGLYQRILAP